MHLVSLNVEWPVAGLEWSGGKVAGGEAVVGVVLEEEHVLGFHMRLAEEAAWQIM